MGCNRRETRILLSNEVINKSNKVKEGKKGLPDQMMLRHRVTMTDPGVTVILNK